MRQREISYGLVKRAAAAGFDTLFFTVDTPIAGARLRDKRNGFSIPPQISLGTVANAIPRPWWWVDFLTTPTLSFASLSSTGGTVGELLNSAMDPSIQFSDLEEIRSMWPGKLVVKGVQNVEDTGIMHGADIVAAMAMGAKFTFIGRAYLYGLMAGGEAGVTRAIEILAEQVRRTMQLLQVETIDELSPKHVTQLTRLTPRTQVRNLEHS